MTTQPITPEEIAEEWIADRNLTDRQVDVLRACVDETLDTIGEVGSFCIAPSVNCQEVDLSPGSYWAEVFAAILDERTGEDNLHRLQIELEAYGHRDPEDEDEDEEDDA